jgi:predicted nucleotidyltransferase
VTQQDRAAERAPSRTPGPRAAAARAAVVSALEACDAALAGWEAGSAAFGRADQRSDLDVVVLCIRGGATHTLDAIEHFLRRAPGGDDLVRWNVGASKFGPQRFWRPAAGAGDEPWCMVDATVIELERERDQWQELLLVERHGRALTLHDPEGVLERCRAQAHFDVDAHRERIRIELERIAARRSMFHDFATKELDRGRDLDALVMHEAMVAAPLVRLLGIRHRPLRWDFSRYLHDELPDDVVAKLVPIVHPPQDALREAIGEGMAWIDELLTELDVDALPIDEHASQMRAAFD